MATLREPSLSMHEERSDREVQSETDWESELIAACETLRRSPEALIRAISVSLRVDDDPIKFRAITGRAFDLADEYGLVASVERVGHSVSVRYQRDNCRNVVK